MQQGNSDIHLDPRRQLRDQPDGDSAGVGSLLLNSFVSNASVQGLEVDQRRREKLLIRELIKDCAKSPYQDANGPNISQSRVERAQETFLTIFTRCGITPYVEANTERGERASLPHHGTHAAVGRQRASGASSSRHLLLDPFCRDPCYAGFCTDGPPSLPTITSLLNKGASLSDTWPKSAVTCWEMLIFNISRCNKQQYAEQQELWLHVAELAIRKGDRLPAKTEVNGNGILYLSDSTDKRQGYDLAYAKVAELACTLPEPPSKKRRQRGQQPPEEPGGGPIRDGADRSGRYSTMTVNLQQRNGGTVMDAPESPSGLPLWRRSRFKALFSW